MNSAFAGKVAIVTGAASGIGRAAAQAFVARGAQVVLADIDEVRGRATARDLGEERALFVPTDVSRDADCGRLLASALERWGRLDYAFNNAGIVGAAAFTADYGAANWQRVIDVNLTGVFNCMAHELKVMKERGGAIVNTASVMGTIGTPGGSAYCAAKHGVIGLTKAAALEYGRNGVRINAICPGYVATDMTVGEKSLFSEKALQAGVARTALRRIASAEEVAELVAWLCSDQAAYVTGAAYSIDGGFVSG